MVKNIGVTLEMQGLRTLQSHHSRDDFAAPNSPTFPTTSRCVVLGRLHRRIDEKLK